MEDEHFSWLERCVVLTFRLYPRGYRQEFEQEMRSVYSLAAVDAMRGGVLSWLRFLTRELWGVFTTITKEYLKLAFHRGGRQTRALDGVEGDTYEVQSPFPGGSHSWGVLLAGSAIFLIWGLDFIAGEIAFSLDEPWFGVFITANQVLSWLIFLLPPIVVGYAYTRDFPRWTYAYVGSALLYSYFMAANFIATPYITLFGTTIGTYHPWGWIAWIPLFLSVSVALLITRSLRPLGRFFSNAWLDWTLLSYAMLGWAPVILIASFDEMPASLTLIFMPLVVTIMVAAALLYLASRSIFQRGWILFGGAFLSLGITLVVTEIYWSGIEYLNVGRIALILAVFLGILFAPGLIGVVRMLRKPGIYPQP